jgi:hypothetical protein
MNDIAMLVRDDLDFDVPRAIDVFLKVDAGVTKSCFGFGLGLRDGRLQGRFIGGDTHPFSTATGRGFDEDRESDLACSRDGIGILQPLSHPRINSQYFCGASRSIASLISVTVDMIELLLHRPPPVNRGKRGAWSWEPEWGKPNRGE